MSLQMIGAGLPRTGTSSLREALRYLLDAPIHHMSEAFEHPEHARTWVDAIEGHPPEWETFLAGYAAGVDAPFPTCWRDLATAFPDDERLSEVRLAIEPDRLIEWKPGDGWAPICGALDVPVPVTGPD